MFWLVWLRFRIRRSLNLFFLLQLFSVASQYPTVNPVEFLTQKYTFDGVSNKCSQRVQNLNIEERWKCKL